MGVTLERLRERIFAALEEEYRVAIRLQGEAFREAMGIESSAHLEHEVEIFARENGWQVEKLGDCFSFSKE